MSGRVYECLNQSSWAEDQSVKTLREYLKVKDAAKFLGVSQTTLRKWADEGRIPVHVNPLNSYRLFRQSDLEAFLKAVAKPSRKPR